MALIVKISEPADHRIHLDNFTVELLVISGSFVDLLGKLEVPSLFILKRLTHPELRFEVDCELAVLSDDFFDICDEFVVGVDLLLD